MRKLAKMLRIKFKTVLKKKLDEINLRQKELKELWETNGLCPKAASASNICLKERKIVLTI